MLWYLATVTGPHTLGWYQPDITRQWLPATKGTRKGRRWWEGTFALRSVARVMHVRPSHVARAIPPLPGHTRITRAAWRVWLRAGGLAELLRRQVAYIERKRRAEAKARG